MKERKRGPRWPRRVAALVLAGLLFILLANALVVRSAAPHLKYRVDEVPAADVALVLGCSRQTPHGENLYFRARIEAAAALYRAGKVRHLLVSGDNHIATYNEPEDMRGALVARGVPREAITLDYAGFRTLDSLVRAHDVFGLRRLIVVTQPWHAARAIYIGQRAGMAVDAFCAADVRQRSWRLRQGAREAVARTWMLLDVHLFRTRPHFPGPPEPPIVV